MKSGAVTRSKLADGSIPVMAENTLPADGLPDPFLAEVALGHLASAVIDRAMASDDAPKPSLVTIPEVPLIEAGVEYELSTGPATFTPEDLSDMVTAANEDPSIPSPRFKLGHIDPRFNGKEYDATPAFGKFVNLRLSENGMIIYADHVGAPAWLAGIMASAYPSRSVEAFPNVESLASGKTWRYVLLNVGALGINWPGIRQLEDLPLYYGEDKPDDVEVVAAKGSDQMGQMAAANLDDVRRAWYNDYVQENQDARWWWIRAVLVDPNELVVEDDEDGQLYRVPFAASAKGEVSFGDASAVRIDYVDDETPEEKKAASQYVAAALVVDRKVEASWSSRAESRPVNATQEGAMDRATAIRTLGLPEDASDEQIQTALTEFVHVFEPENPTAAVQAANAPAEEEEEEEEGPVEPEPAVAPISRSQLRAATGRDKDKPLVQLDRSTYDALLAQVKLGVSAHERLEKVERDQLLDEAMAAGKFPPARRDAWEKYMQTDYEGAKAALAELQPGLVPIQEIGGGGPGEEEEAIIYPIHLFPEIQKRKAREAAVAAGLREPGRVQTDGSMRRGV